MEAARWYAGAAAGTRLVREHQAGRMSLCIAGTHERLTIVKHRGLYQGAALSPNIFQWTDEYWVWSRWDAMAEMRGWGVTLNGERLARMTWADDNLLIATSISQLREMWSAAKSLLRDAQFDR